MGRLDWDRLRRTRPLDGADRRVDPDGESVWEQPKEDPYVPFGARRLRRGVIVRAAKDSAPDLVRCPRCGERIAARKTVRHASRCPRAQTTSPSSHGSKSVAK